MRVRIITVDQNYRIDIVCDPEFTSHLLAKLALQRSEFKLRTGIVGNYPIDGTVAKIADAIKKDHALHKPLVQASRLQSDDKILQQESDRIPSVPARKLSNMESEVLWQAVKTRDARFNGAFVFAVRTTGIFCKPSCSAKAAKRENVVFFDAVAAARSAGFRACLRCKPESPKTVDPQVELVLKACKLLEVNDEISIDMVADELGLSKSHFQRTFKEIMGVSPKKYAEAKKMDRFKDELRSGSDVTTAMYEAGYGSSRGLYEKAASALGMTPAIYKKGGKGMTIRFVVTDCELGKLLVARTSKGVCSVTIGDSAAELEKGLLREFAHAQIAKDAKQDAELRSAVDAILAYMSGKNRRLVLPLDLKATAFQLQVWEFLQKIPYGETRSYSEVAEALGDKKKVRAVAQACARNRVAMVIPCHRVVASSGELSGYRWGVERKKRLLEKEQG
jgi:AraC family transcriptional regulator of adaptative response/methylated-DNA-[protein]-cysteine methyltransferase